MLNHKVGSFNRAWFKRPHAAIHVLHVLKQEVSYLFAASSGPGNAEDSEYPRGNEVLTDGDCLLTHPLRSGTGDRQVADVITKATILNHGGSCYQDATVIHTGAHVQYRWNTYRLAH